ERRRLVLEAGAREDHRDLRVADHVPPPLQHAERRDEGGGLGRRPDPLEPRDESLRVLDGRLAHRDRTAARLTEHPQHLAPGEWRRTSGIRQSRSAASSRPIVFLPSRRYGSLSVDRSNQPSSGATCAATLPAVRIEPSRVKTWAPAICASAIAAGGVPRGTM